MDNQYLNPRRVSLSIAGLMAFAALLSLAFFSHQSLRLDESQSLWQTSNTPSGILHTVAEDVHVPLYHLVLHFWEFFLGNNVIVARLLSMLFFLASIPALYILGRRIYGPRVGLLAATFFTLSPFMNWYGNEIRMYSLFTFIAILNHYFFIRIYQEKNDAGWIGYAVTGLLGIYIHYFFWLLLLTQAIFYFTYRNQLFAKGSFRRFLLVAVILVIALSPWLYFVRQTNLLQNQTPHLGPPTSFSIFSTFAQFLFGFQDDHLNSILLAFWPLSVLLGFLALRKSSRVNPTNVYLVMSLIIPILTAFAISSFLEPVYLNRYLIFTLPPMFLFFASIISNYPPPLSRAFKIIVVVVMLFTLANEGLSATTPVKEDYKAATDYLSSHAKPQDIIVVSAPFTVYPVEYYYRGVTEIATLPVWDRFKTGAIPPFDEADLPNQVNQLKDTHENLWLLLSYDQGYEEKIRIYFDTHLERIDAKNFSPGLNLYEYKLRYDVDYMSATTTIKNLRDGLNN